MTLTLRPGNKKTALRTHRNWLWCSALVLSGCGGTPDGSGGDLASGRLAEIGRHAVLAQDLASFAQVRGGQRAAVNPSEPQVQWQSLLDELIERQLAADLTDELGLSDDPEFAAQRAAIRQRAALEEAALIERQLLTHLSARAEPDSDDIAQYYETQKTRFLTRRARLDAFEFTDAATASSARDAIIADVADATAPQVGAQRLTPLGWVSRTSQRGEVRRALLSVSTGQPVSPVFGDESGARIFVLREERTNEPRPLSDVREQLIGELKIRSARAQLSDLLRAARARVQVDDDALRDFVAVQPAPRAPRSVRVSVPVRADDAQRGARSGH